MAKLLNYYDAKKFETTNTIETDTTQDWDATVTYAAKDEVKYNDIVYISLADTNTGNQPDQEPTKWYPDRPVNEKAIYDVYPTTVSTNTTQTITLEYNVTDPVDFIYVGNAYGDKVTITMGGYQISENVDTSNNPYSVWNIDSPYYGSINAWLKLPAPQTGTIKVEITQNTDDNIARVGYVSFGLLEYIGCTIMSDAIKYNVISGVQFKGKVSGLNRVRSDSWTEMSIPILVRKNDDMDTVIKALSKYRGIPTLLVPDDTADRRELVFFGVYTDIDASITDQNKYILNLSSLDIANYVPATDQEENQLQDDTGGGNTPDDLELNSFVFAGVTGGDGDNITLTTSDTLKTLKAGDTFYIVPQGDNTGAVTIDINGLGAVNVVDEAGNALNAGDIKAGSTIEVQYDGTNIILRKTCGADHINVVSTYPITAADFDPCYKFVMHDGSTALWDKGVLHYIDDEGNIVALKRKSNNDLTITVPNDFATIEEAIDHIRTHYDNNTNGTLVNQFEINLNNYKMNNSLIFESGNFSNIKITGSLSDNGNGVGITITNGATSPIFSCDISIKVSYNTSCKIVTSNNSKSFFIGTGTEIIDFLGSYVELFRCSDNSSLLVDGYDQIIGTKNDYTFMAARCSSIDIANINKITFKALARSLSNSRISINSTDFEMHDTGIFNFLSAGDNSSIYIENDIQVDALSKQVLIDAKNGSVITLQKLQIDNIETDKRYNSVFTIYGNSTLECDFFSTNVTEGVGIVDTSIFLIDKCSSFSGTIDLGGTRGANTKGVSVKRASCAYIKPRLDRAGTTSSDDLIVTGGSTVTIDSTYTNYSTGTNISVNTFTSDGVIWEM